MFYRVAFFIVSLLVGLACLSQGKEDKNRDLHEIRNKYQRINNTKGLKVITIEAAEEFIGHATDGGGKLQGYYKNDTLVKIVEWVGLSNKIFENEYYLHKNGLFFVYSKEQQYPYNDSLQALDYSSLVPTFSGRYYFKNNKLIETILSHKRAKQSVNADASAILKRVGEYSLLLNSRKK